MSKFTLLLTSLTVALVTLISVNPLQAQLGDRLMRAAQRGAERALERNTERKTSEGVDKVFEKPNKNRRSDEEDVDGESVGLEEGDYDSEDSAAPSKRSAKGSTKTEAPARTPFSTTSKYDFEPGAQVIGYDNFARTNVGDLPTGYNTLGGLEVFTTNTAPGKWIRINSTAGQVAAFDFTEFPENFTLEFDMIVDIPQDGYRYHAEFGTMFTTEGNPEASMNERLHKVGKRNIIFWIDRDISNGFFKSWQKSVAGEVTKGNAARIDDVIGERTRGDVHRVSIWRQGKRMRMYLNERKAFDIPLAWGGDDQIKAMRFIGQFSEASDGVLVSNIRLAKGAPDTRSKLEKEGKLVTYGITFASGSDEVEASSAATLKQIAKALTDKPNMKIRITGHTDGDGDATANQALSERRAAAVKSVLAQHYGIDKARVTTAGKGESEPVSDNDSEIGKAQNRRVVIEVVR